ncbi:MAG: hypothetical protein V3U31_00225 [Dehalococcoidia bacterium]
MPGDDIKTAFERAWEKAQRIEAPDGKMKELQYGPDGARLVARFLKEDGVDLAQELAAYPPEVRQYVEKGVQSTLVSNITLPRMARLRRDSDRAMEGLMALKRDKSRFASFRDKVEALFAYYERARQETYNNLRQETEAALRQQMRQQGVNSEMRIDVENHPEFRQRWQELSASLDREAEERLGMLMGELNQIS